jgi:outer membrane protein assembly factor BamB
VSTVVAPPRRRAILRVWAPLVVFALLGGAFATVWSLPYEEFARFYRVVISFGIVSLATLLFLVWWFFLSGIAWSLRLALPLVVVALAFACIRKVDFSGDMIPLVWFRWETDPRAQLRAYQQSQAEASVADDEAAATPVKENPADYPEYRNRARDGVAHGPALARNWDARPLEQRELWKHPCGGGYAGFAVAGGLAVTIEQRDEDEAIVCYDTATGNERWAYHYPAHFYDFRAQGPMATPTLVGGDVYSLGGTGWLISLRLATGKVNWKVNILDDNDNLTWGMSGSPLVYGDVVVVTPGEQRPGRTGNAVIAYDRKTGKKVWGAGDTKGGYSSPMLTTLCGVRQIVVLDGKVVAGYDRAGGGRLWSLPWPADNDINVAQPLRLDDDRLFVTTGYGSRCGVIGLVKDDDKLKPEAGWRNAALRCRFCSPVLYQGLIYGLNEGIVTCLDPDDGRKVWSGKRYGQGQLLRSDDLLLILSEQGELCLVQAAAGKSKELTRVKVLPGDKTWNCPCLADGKAYIRNHLEMACYDLRE